MKKRDMSMYQWIEKKKKQRYAIVSRIPDVDRKDPDAVLKWVRHVLVIGFGREKFKKLDMRYPVAKLYYLFDGEEYDKLPLRDETIFSTGAYSFIIGVDLYQKDGESAVAIYLTPPLINELGKEWKKAKMKVESRLF